MNTDKTMDAIRKYLENGHLLSPELYAKLGTGGSLHFDTSDIVVTDGHIVDYKNPERKALSIREITALYSERYRFLSSIIADKINPISIDKLREGKAELIGIIRDGEIEDLTGAVQYLSSVAFHEDEVVGARGVFKNGVFEMEEVIYPDIPLSNSPRYAEKKSLVCVSAGNVSSIAKERNAFHISFSSYSLASVNGLKILHCPAFASEKEATQALRRRHLFPASKNLAHENLFLLKEIPDIVYAIGPNFIVNYKGVTFVSAEKEKAAIIDLATRAVEMHPC